MSVYTFVVAFETPPRIGADTDILGGKLHAVQFDDALARLEDAEKLVDTLKSQLSACKSDLATACLLSTKSAEQAQAFAAALAEAQKVPAGYWADKE